MHVFSTCPELQKCTASVHLTSPNLPQMDHAVMVPNCERLFQLENIKYLFKKREKSQIAKNYMKTSL